jgi:hypothetical protein
MRYLFEANLIGIVFLLLNLGCWGLLIFVVMKLMKSASRESTIPLVLIKGSTATTGGYSRTFMTGHVIDPKKPGQTVTIEIRAATAPEDAGEKRQLTNELADKLIRVVRYG